MGYSSPDGIIAGRLLNPIHIHIHDIVTVEMNYRLRKLVSDNRRRRVPLPELLPTTSHAGQIFKNEVGEP